RLGILEGRHTRHGTPGGRLEVQRIGRSAPFHSAGLQAFPRWSGSPSGSPSGGVPLATSRGKLGEMADHRPFSADGYSAGWVGIDDGRAEQLSLNWDNEAWTASVHVEHERIDYVVRVSPLWQIRQFLLFRDMEQPDLWLGTDGHGRWGELNGAHRPELDGALDITIAGSPFVHSITIRRLPLSVGDDAALIMLAIDPETLAV